jgi:hypothetical protein
MYFDEYTFDALVVEISEVEGGMPPPIISIIK